MRSIKWYENGMYHRIRELCNTQWIILVAFYFLCIFKIDLYILIIDLQIGIKSLIDIPVSLNHFD